MIKKIIILIIIFFTTQVYGIIIDEFGDEINLNIKREKYLVAPLFSNAYISGEIALTEQNYLFIRIDKTSRRTDAIYDIDAIKINGKQYKIKEIYNNNSYCCYVINLNDINTNKTIEYTILNNGRFIKSKI